MSCKKFDDAQTKTLNDHYLQTSIEPDFAARTRLAAGTGLTFDQVTNWFKNKRQRTKQAPAVSFLPTYHVQWTPGQQLPTAAAVPAPAASLLPTFHVQWPQQCFQVLCEGGQLRPHLRTTTPVPTHLLFPQFAWYVPSPTVVGRPQFARPVPSPAVDRDIVAWTLEEIVAASHAPLAEEDAAATLAPGPRATASKQQGGCDLEELEDSGSTCSSSRDEDFLVELLDAEFLEVADSLAPHPSGAREAS